MSTVLYFSDIHIEIREKAGRLGWTERTPLDLGPDLRAWAGKADLLVLAGDIGRMRSTRDVSTLTYASQAAEFLGCPAVVVPGNHEYYRGSFDEERDALLAARVEGVTVLDRGEARYPTSAGELRVLGATLWTDYAANGDPAEAMRRAQEQIEDHRLIARSGGAPFRPQDALAEHRASRAWLAARLAEPHDGPTLVVTHHVPHSAACHPRFGITPLSPAFHSDCDELIGAAARARVLAWVFGHHHWSHEVELRGVRLVSAQTGYPGEATGWTGPGVLPIPAGR
ncbi:MAG: metallophosphoesterase [Betaproteobacteria bacterium]|nr:metallophosphoesterase [Betaproteobacteria bacterium]